MSHQIKTLPASQIHTQGLQVRAQTDRAHVDDLVELFGDDGVWPAALPPCVVFCDGKDYFLADGHHRRQSAQEAGCAEIPCEVRQGDKTAALWYAIGANGDHGLRRTNEDKRRAVLMAYQLDPSLSDNAIAKRCRVSPGMANYVLRPVRSAPLSNLDSGAALSQKDSCRADDTQESMETPWEPERDSRNEQSSTTRPDEDGACDAEPTPSTIPAAAAASSSQPARPAPIGAAPEPVPDIRTDARGRQMNVSRIGRGRKADKLTAGPTDALGVPLAPATAPIFLTALELDGVVKLLKEAQTRLAAIAAAPGAELLRTNALLCEKRDGEERYRSADIANAIKEIQHWRPYTAVCPSCKGDPSPDCKVCLGLPYVIRAAFERCSGQLQEAVKAMVPQAALA